MSIEKQEKILKSSSKEDFSRTLKATFGQKPNRANLVRFFSEPIVKKLWFSDGGNGFQQSLMCTDILDQLDESTKKSFFKHTYKFLTPGLRLWF